MRLDKFISHSTGLSRTDSKKAIKGARVTLDGLVVSDPAITVKEDQQVALDGTPTNRLGPLYIMLHKPMGYVSATHDSQNPTVLELLPHHLRSQLQIVGRLDKDTTGLLLLTNDGQWNHRITNPNQQCTKRYQVHLDSAVDAIQLQHYETHLQQGLQLKSESKPLRPATVEQISSHVVRITVHEGKYHQVKRMFAALGNHVRALHRDRIGELELDDLAVGEWRDLHPEEITTFN